MSTCTPKIGIWAAMLSVLFAACFSIVALAANFTTLNPATWVNPSSFAPSLLLAWSYLVLMACVLDAVNAWSSVIPVMVQPEGGNLRPFQFVVGILVVMALALLVRAEPAPHRGATPVPP
jgi:hypothetical protein